MSADTEQTWLLENEAATVDFGRALGEAAAAGAVIYLDGHLGAGKTTLCRGVLRAFGHAGAVKSPTYTLVEPYELDAATVYHFDLYRLGEPEELEYMGVRDYFDGHSLCLVEWPQRGAGVLPSADLTVSMVAQGGGRRLSLQAHSPRGEAIAATLAGQ